MKYSLKKALIKYGSWHSQQKRQQR